MKVKFEKRENSNRIRIPNFILRLLNLKPNDKAKKQNLSLKEKIKQYKGPNLAKDFCWDEPKGKEIW